MLLLLCCILGAVLAQATTAHTNNKVDHVVFLMLENRAFDHMFGYRPGVDGVVGKDLYNLVDPSDPSSEKIRPSRDAKYIAPCSPDHGTTGTTNKIFGWLPDTRTNFSDPTMAGFVQTELKEGHKDFCDVMKLWDPSRIPVISFLADNYALFDKFFCSHPGPTWPNRMYAIMGTSAGSTGTGEWWRNEDGSFFPQTTIFDQMEEQGRTWKVVYDDTPWELFIKKIAESPGNLQQMEDFIKSCSTGDLPSYTWINPRSGVTPEGLGSNDQHPDHDVALGELLIKRVYEAVRASPAWNRTLLIVTYDEHGGFWDHVPPPQPAPGQHYNFTYPNADFKFDRLGVRVPFLAISPLISKGIVVGSPEKSQYEFTSVLKTARQVLGLKNVPLSARDAWAASFEHVLSLEKPRTDCPLKTPAAPPVTQPKAHMFNQEHSDLQQDMIEWLAHLVGAKDHPGRVSRTGLEGSVLIRKYFRKHLDLFPKLVNCVVCTGKLRPKQSFWVNKTRSDDDFYYTISLRQHPFLCLQHNDALGLVFANECSSHHSQRWLWNDDRTLRPHDDRTKCMGTKLPARDRVIVEPCATPSPLVTQRWAVQGPAPGDSPNSGVLYYGDTGKCITVH